MSLKFYLVASLILLTSAAAGDGLIYLANIYLFINVSDLPSKGSDVLDPNVEAGLQNNMQEINDVRQKREAIAELKDTDVKGKGSKNTKGKRKSSNGKRKSSERKRKSSERKRKSSKGKVTEEGNPMKRKSSKGKGKEKQKSNQKRKSSTRKRKFNKRNRKSSKGQVNGKEKSKIKRKSSKGKRKSKRKTKGKRKSKGKQKSEGKQKSKGKLSGQLRQTTAKVNLTCLRDAVTFTKFLKDSVINFLRKNTRLTRQNSLTSKSPSYLTENCKYQVIQIRKV